MQSLSLAPAIALIAAVFGIMIGSSSAVPHARLLRSHTSILEDEFVRNHASEYTRMVPFGVQKVKTEKMIEPMTEKKTPKTGKQSVSPPTDRKETKKQKQKKKDEAAKLSKVSGGGIKGSENPTLKKKKGSKTPKGCRKLHEKKTSDSSKTSKYPKSSKASSSGVAKVSTHSPSASSSSRKSNKDEHSKLKQSKGEEIDDELEAEDCELAFDETPIDTFAPTASPSQSRQSFPPFPAGPSEETDKTITLATYSLLYDIKQTRIPLLTDYDPLTDLTDDYLNRYFGFIFSQTPQVEFKSSRTEVKGSEFRLAQPVKVDFSTTLSFAATSLLPDEMDLQALLAGAFEGSNGDSYAEFVADGLHPDNIFVTTSFVAYKLSVTTTRAQRVAAGFAVYALNAIVVVLAVFAFQSKRFRSTQGEYGKALVDHMSVSGNTAILDERTVESGISTHEILFSVSNESSSSESGESMGTGRIRIIGARDILSQLDEDSRGSSGMPERWAVNQGHR